MHLVMKAENAYINLICFASLASVAALPRTTNGTPNVIIVSSNREGKLIYKTPN